MRLPKHIPELDGFRGIAILMVMSEHTYEIAHTGWHPPAVLGFLLAHGWLGVDLFFVLSGFLITGILLDERDRPDYFRSFYRRRACRILPLALTVLVLCSILYRPEYNGAFFTSFLLTLFFCANFNILFHVLAAPGTGVMWSLAVEEHFYLLWPLIIRRAPRVAIGSLAVAIILLSPIARGLAMHYGVQPRNVYQLSWFRFDGLAMGALLAVFVRSEHFTARNVWALALSWLAAILAASVILAPYGALAAKSSLGEALRYTQAQGLFGAAMVIALAHQGSQATAILRTRFLGWVAEISYCLYLIHMPMGHFYHWAVREIGIHPGIAVRYLVVFSLSFALATLSGKYLEAPFRRMRVSGSGSPLLRVASSIQGTTD